MSELILWRHGQTDFNRGGRIQGRSDIALNELGRAQARRVAPAIAALAPTRLVSSPLRRAHETAEALAAVTGLGVETLEGLTERSFGPWEGLTRAEVESGWPEAFAAWRRGEDPEGVEVETRAATAQRVASAVRAALDPGREDERVVVVAHGAALTLATTELLGLDPSGWFGLRGLDNCRFARLRTTERRPGLMLAGWNLDAAAPEAVVPGGDRPQDIGAFLS